MSAVLTMAEPTDWVDFSAIPPAQHAIHDRLENWGRSCHSPLRRGAAPGFDAYQTPNKWDYGRETFTVVDQHDAKVVGHAVSFLPSPHRLSLHWYYVQRTSVLAGRRLLACTAESLSRYVIDGRWMLINRRV